MSTPRRKTFSADELREDLRLYEAALYGEPGAVREVEDEMCEGVEEEDADGRQAAG